MSQRWSEYGRVNFDQYETPEWVTSALVPHLYPKLKILEPACGTGKMVAALQKAGFSVVGQDIQDGADFLARDYSDVFDAIVTNPPYNKAGPFVEHALKLMKPKEGVVAMLLRTDFDHAKTRRHLFADNPAFKQKIVLTKRIVWFDRPGAAPSFNHAWFVWDWSKNWLTDPVITWDFQ